MSLADLFDLRAKNIAQIAGYTGRSDDETILELRELAAYLYERAREKQNAAYSHDKAGRAANYCQDDLSKAFHRLKAAVLFNRFEMFEDSTYSLLYGAEAMLYMNAEEIKKLGLNPADVKDLSFKIVTQVLENPDYSFILCEEKFDGLLDFYWAFA